MAYFVSSKFKLPEILPFALIQKNDSIVYINFYIRHNITCEKKKLGDPTELCVN